MGLALVGYVLVNIALFGFFALFARGVRFRATSGERQDLEENSFIDEEWRLVRREQCGPTGCPRAVGTPPGPRRDVTCEICAAVFMERYWRRKLATRSSEWAGGTVAVGHEPGARRAVPAKAHRLRRLLLAAGFILAFLGASLAFLSPGVFPGYLLIATGLGCLIRSGSVG
jgi:hypothetical protein